MTPRRRPARHWAVAVAVGLGLAAAPADASGLCDLLLVPDESGLACTPVASPSPEVAAIAVIEPVEGAFGELSRLTVRRLAEPVADPDAWLRRQVTLDFGGLDEYVAGVVEDVDSPFAGTSFGEALIGLARRFEELGRLPLRGCERATPEIDGRRVEEMRCLYEAGPLRQHLIVRLVENGGETYAFTMRAMNERRLRHLLAIANGFAAS
jgi:hypothetical protein